MWLILRSARLCCGRTMSFPVSTVQRAMQITWYGHSAFRLDFADKAVLIDPFFTGNPAFQGDRDKLVAGTTHILITHGHSDHVGDTLDIAAATGAKVVG